MFHSAPTRLRIDTAVFGARSLRPLTAFDTHPRDRALLHHEYERWMTGARALEGWGEALLERAAARPRTFLHASILALAAIAAAAAIGG
jgi:hypothetical protein